VASLSVMLVLRLAGKRGIMANQQPISLGKITG